ncbi:hypothetical protein L2E82_32640 [Cichorium intybus]|uniref:Uncharacterized protein n=1 Tax=Cichorium intybus TaxID=13427 RepID=A0ACB9BIR9_CICIN|nr:hypothetical protein L2E82_32640 [Cichorium intybus]
MLILDRDCRSQYSLLIDLRIRDFPLALYQDIRKGKTVEYSHSQKLLFSQNYIREVQSKILLNRGLTFLGHDWIWVGSSTTVVGLFLSVIASGFHLNLKSERK